MSLRGTKQSTDYFVIWNLILWFFSMIIRSPREQKFSWLQSFVKSDFVEPVQPKMTQTHSDRVVIITSPDQIVWEADGMVTSLKNLELQVRVADCGNINLLVDCHAPLHFARNDNIITLIFRSFIASSWSTHIILNTSRTYHPVRCLYVWYSYLAII